MCMYPACVGRSLEITYDWVMGGLCANHMTGLAAKYGHGTLSEELVLDYVKIHILLQFNKERRIRHIRKLDQELQAAKDNNPQRSPLDTRFAKNSPNYVKLSRALEYYEGYCWFPANRVLIASLLSSEAFGLATQLGFNKDSGAGLKHGDKSHRIQWHAIMREVTNDFSVVCDRSKGWLHSPLELYWKMTHGESSSTFKVWGNLMDGVSNDHKGWGNPDNLMVELRQAGLTLVTAALERRVVKHGGKELVPQTLAGVTMSPRYKKLWDIAKTMTDDLRDNELHTPYRQLLLQVGGTGPGSIALAIMNLVYGWEKMGFPRDTPNKNSVEYYALECCRQVLKHDSFYFRNGLTKRYNSLSPGLGLNHSSPDQGVQISESRVNNSKHWFNLGDYQYLPAFGANPAPGEHNKKRW